MNEDSARGLLAGGIMKRIDHDDIGATLYLQVSCPDGILRCAFFEDAMYSELNIDDTGLPFSRVEEVSMETLTSKDYINAVL